MSERFWGVKEVMRLTGKSRPTIWRWARAGHFPKPRRIGPNSIGWLQSEVEAWTERHRKAVTGNEPVAAGA